VIYRLAGRPAERQGDLLSGDSRASMRQTGRHTTNSRQGDEQAGTAAIQEGSTAGSAVNQEGGIVRRGK
jgi:hypothetical protein